MTKPISEFFENLKNTWATHRLSDISTTINKRQKITKQKNIKKCLPTNHVSSHSYKMIMSILKERIVKFIEFIDIFPFEPKWCKKEYDGCKNKLFINKMMVENFQSKQKKKLSVAWIV